MSSDLNTISGQTHSDAAETDAPVVVFEILEVLGKRAFVPILAIPAILGLTPIGASVVFAVLTCTVFIWVGIQLLMGRQSPYLPSGLLYSRVKNPLTQWVTSWILQINEWLDRVPNRLGWITSTAFAALPCLGLICVGIALPVLVFAGQSVFLLCIATLIYCVSILTRDGRYVLAAATVLSIASISPIFQLAT